MSYKERAESLLLILKKKGFDRRTLEKELGYSEKSIDQILSKGGNKKFVENLERFIKASPDSESREVQLLNKLIDSLEARLKDADEKIKNRENEIDKLKDENATLKKGLPPGRTGTRG